MRYFLFIIIINILIGYYNQDPRMIAVAGAYNTLATGYQSVGINPANLAFSKGITMNLFQINFNGTNNFLTKKRISKLKGANLDDPSDKKYFSKNEILAYLNEEPVHIGFISNFPIPMFNFSSNSYAITSEFKTFSNINISQDFFKFILYGNEIDSIYNFSINNHAFTVMESSISKGFKFDNIGFGFTFKYLKGILGFSYESLNNSEFITTSTDINLRGSSYLFRQNTMGDGFAFDIGITTKENKDGWKFGLSVINLFGNIKWNKRSFLDKQLESFYSTIYDATELREKEHFYFDLSINDLNLDAINSDNISLSDLFIIDTIAVYESTQLPNSDIYFESTLLENYYVPTDSLCIGQDISCTIESALNDLEPNIIEMDYPTIFTMGFSKRVDESQLYIIDISTGLDDSFNNKEKWRIAIGAEFGNKIFPFRLGYSYGGYDYMSLGMGFGLHIPTSKGSFSIDFGFGYKSSIDFNESNGIDFGLGFYWMQI